MSMPCSDVAAAPNQKLILMPLEAGGVIGAIGGIAELAKQALSSGGNSGGQLKA